MKQWSILLYVAGDNDLESAALTSLGHLLSVGASEEVEVLVQLDGRGGARRLRVPAKGESSRALQPVGPRIPQANTGSPALLTEFLSWARESYPAHHTMLVLWGHGTGWENPPEGFNWGAVRGAGSARSMFRTTLQRVASAPENVRAFGLDATSRDFLDNDELRSGLAEGLQGEKLDILGFDACLMGMIEVMYHLRDQAHLAVASQESVPESSWPYDVILRALHAAPEMSPSDLGTTVVDAYRDTGLALRGSAKYTLAALDLDRIPTTALLIQEVAAELKNRYASDDFTVQRAISRASKDQTGAKRFSDHNSVDLYDWLKLLGRELGPDHMALQAQVTDLLAHLTVGSSGGLIRSSSAEVGSDRAKIHGTSIYLPCKDYSPYYDMLDFADTGWGKFVQTVLSKRSVGRL